MLWWENDYLTTPSYSSIKTQVNSDKYLFAYWTNYKPKVDLFYANGTINYNQVN
jgi:hypothetical protein